ncbi:hypothetical protein Sa4125_21860 [Aureimonas sp. SA4125]|uniref:transporter n=1 Tax=Aureimonas sp. SA4125 TaxID=2826993 RepID=UPI001CC7642A|nr:transporter [Aureimonas sp. SA4125]BDA84644.1 hypothetical protein Sa4125_21860 [Aureimonas sp. SA4125]
MIIRFQLFAIALAVVPTVALGQPTSEPSPICTDRPTKATSVCTGPAGTFQLEADLPNWTRLDDAGTQTDTVLYANPTLKLGLGPNTDIQANIAPYVDVRTRAGGVVSHVRGVGDLFVRVKQRLTNPAAKVQVGVVPYIKAPLAKRGIGNREWEGGVVVPVQFSLPQSFTLTFAPEMDVLADGDGSGKHVQLIGVVNLAKPLSSKITAYAELWTAQNYDPAGTVRQYSADVALAYLASPTLQFDVGGNFGLNRATPDAQIYFGISTRF